MNNPPPCPYLPQITDRIPAAVLGKFRGTRKSPELYLTALTCAQSRWQEALPAQSLLMLNRALAINFAEWSTREQATIEHSPPPYAALAWIIQHGEQFGFLGNPRRHFQHLATRMSGPHRELRIARAWACWLIVRKIRPDFIADDKQLREELFTEPSPSGVRDALRSHVLPFEFQAWLDVAESPHIKNVCPNR